MCPALPYQITCTPNDVEQYTNPCRNTDTLFLPKPKPLSNDQWSKNIYDFTRSIVEGCHVAYGTTEFSFENELDNRWSGLGADSVYLCVPDGPYDREFFKAHPEVDPAELGRHLAHHYIQGYFSFIDGIRDADHALRNPGIKGYPFAMSVFPLGVLVARWIYRTGDNGQHDPKSQYGLFSAIKFSNIYFATIGAQRLEKKGMKGAYYGGTSDVPWPQDNPELWLADFGYATDPVIDPNTIDKYSVTQNPVAIFNYAFIEQIFKYATDVDSKLYLYFSDGILIHDYYHWSCLLKILEYLEDQFSGVPDIPPLFFEELGCSDRLIGSDSVPPGYKCDKLSLYVSGTRGMDLVEGIQYYTKLHATQVAELARKLLLLSSPAITIQQPKKTITCDCKGILWFWMMTWEDYEAGKGTLAKYCGANPTLPGYRFPAFDAYRLLTKLLKDFTVTEHIVRKAVTGETFEGKIHIVTLTENDGPRKISAYWGFYDEDTKPGESDYTWVFKEELSGTISFDNSFSTYHIYDALGIELGHGGGNNMDVFIDTSPRYICWNFDITEYIPEEIPREGTDYSHILVPFVHQIRGFYFDKGDKTGWSPDEGWKYNIPFTKGETNPLDDIQGFTWTESGILIVSNGKNGLYYYRALAGKHGECGEYLKQGLPTDGGGTLTANRTYGLAFADNSIYVAVEGEENGIDKNWIWKCNNRGELEESYDLEDPGFKPRQLRILPLETGNSEKPKYILLVGCLRDITGKLEKGTKIKYLLLGDDGDEKLYDLTSIIHEENSNGFDINDAGILFVTSELKRKILVYDTIDWKGLEKEDKAYQPSKSIPIDGRPKGLRITPYGTLAMSIEGDYSKMTVTEFLVQRDKVSDDYVIVGHRNVIMGIEIPSSSGNGDFTLTFNRKGKLESMLRPYLDDYPTIINVNNPVIKIDYIYGENTSNLYDLEVKERKIFMIEKETGSKVTVSQAGFSSKDFDRGVGGHFAPREPIEMNYESTVLDPLTHGKVYTVTIRYTSEYVDMGTTEYDYAQVSFDVRALSPYFIER